jgi:hypothetical protein
VVSAVGHYRDGLLAQPQLAELIASTLRNHDPIPAAIERSKEPAFDQPTYLPDLAKLLNPDVRVEVVLKNYMRGRSEERQEERNFVHEFDDDLIGLAEAKYVQEGGYAHGEQFVAGRADDLTALNDLASACAFRPADQYCHLRSGPPHPLCEFPEDELGSASFGVEVVVPVDEQEAGRPGAV